VLLALQPDSWELGSPPLATRETRGVDWDLFGEWRAAGCPDVPRGKAIIGPRAMRSTGNRTHRILGPGGDKAGKPPASEQREDELLRYFVRS
jgi:hypothetical protein